METGCFRFWGGKHHREDILGDLVSQSVLEAWIMVYEPGSVKVRHHCVHKRWKLSRHSEGFLLSVLKVAVLCQLLQK
jgi:hypothetical protein